LNTPHADPSDHLFSLPEQQAVCLAIQNLWLAGLPDE
jgi:hypothetical protein